MGPQALLFASRRHVASKLLKTCARVAENYIHSPALNSVDRMWMDLFALTGGDEV